MNIFKMIAGLYLPSRYKVTNQTCSTYSKGETHRSILFDQYFIWKEDAVKEFNAWIMLKNYDAAVYVKQGGIWLKIMEWDEVTQKLHIYGEK